MPRYRALIDTYISNRYLRAGDVFAVARPIPDSTSVIEEVDAHNRPIKPTPIAPPADENPVLSVVTPVEPPKDIALDQEDAPAAPPAAPPSPATDPIDFLS